MELLLKDVVRLLKVPEDTVYRWIEEKKLPSCSVNGQFRFNKLELFEWATKNSVALSPDFLGETGQMPALPAVSRMLEQGGIHYGLKGSDTASVLKSVVAAIRPPERLDRDFLFQVLLAREAISSTGIGDGIAIPHPRNPIVLNVQDPLLSLAFLETPVDFGAIDKRPVHALFTLISPTVRSHLQLLSRVAYLLHNKKLKEMLSERAPAGQILAEIKTTELGIKPDHKEK
jgi:nitrogen PTS system EIIA component